MQRNLIKHNSDRRTLSTISNDNWHLKYLELIGIIINIKKILTIATTLFIKFIKQGINK